MALLNGFGQQSSMIVVNGKKMTLSEYKKMIKERSEVSKPKAKKTRKTKRTKRETDITVLPNEIKLLMKNVKVIRSLAAYYDNGYRQWGTVAKNIINMNGIKSPFLHLKILSVELNNIFLKISEVAKGNEKAVYQYIIKYSWKLEDLKKYMNLLYKGVRESGVLEHYGDKECINGEGRRLGLMILMKRTFDSIDEIENIVERINAIGVGHLDAMEYSVDELKRVYRVNK